MAAAVKISVALLFSLALLACSNSLNLEINSEIPSVAMEPSAQRVHLVLRPDFKAYVYRENSDLRENWEINLGNSQSALFSGIFKSAFGDVVISNVDEGSNGAELVFSPQLVELQLATPFETGFKFYEAWLDYDITMRVVSSGDSETINLTAYGKENTARFQRRHEGLHKAIESALRDAGAKLTVALISIANDGRISH